MITINQYMGNLPELRFSYDWNKKLNSRVFTTIRKQNPVRYQKRERFCVVLPQKMRFVAQVADVRHCKAKELSVWEMGLDTGYGREETLDKVLGRMYKLTPQQVRELNISYILLMRVPDAVLEKELSITENTAQ